MKNSDESCRKFAAELSSQAGSGKSVPRAERNHRRGQMLGRNYAVRFRVERATCPFLRATSPQALQPEVSLHGESDCHARLGGKLTPSTAKLAVPPVSTESPPLRSRPESPNGGVSLRPRFFRWRVVASVTALAAIAWSGGAAERSGEDWPRLLGPRANGISGETDLLDAWPAGGPPVLWSKAIGTGYSAPSIRGDQLVLHHRQKDEEIVECLDAATGQSRWRQTYPSQFIDPYGYNNGPRCSPLLTSNLCYTVGAEGQLLCLEWATGQVRWKRDTAKDWQVPAAFFGVGSTPILEGDLLLVMVGGQPNSGMVALNAQTGQTVWESVGESNWQGVPMTGWPGERTVKWRRIDKQASYATPVAATVHGRRHVFCLMRQGLVSLDPKSGAVNFSFWFRSQLEDSVNASCPIVVDDMVFISAAYYRIGSVLLRINPDGRGVTEVWRSTVLENHWMTPLYHEGYLYAFSGRNEPDARFRCVEFKTGKLMWEVDQSWRHSMEPPNVFGRGSCILADDKLIALGEAGLLGLFKLNPLRPEEVNRVQLPQLRYPCWPAPVLSRKRLYLRSEDRLLCLDLARR